MSGAFTQSPVGAYGGASGSAQLVGGLGQGGGGAALDSAAAAAGSTSSSLGSRISDFVEKNKRGLLIGLGATVVVVGSAGAYYYYTKPTPRSKGKGTDGEDSPSIGGVADDSGAAGKRKSKKKKSKKSTGQTATTQERSSSPTVEDGDSEGSADGGSVGLQCYTAWKTKPSDRVLIEV